jgi:serine/threonine protein kinase
MAVDVVSGYHVEASLAEGRSLLARDPVGRRVILKRLDEDCLLKGQLHPMIKDRLGRVRELAHTGVACLLGAERDGDRCFLVWQYVEGCTLGDYLQKTGGRVASRMARELVAAVESLHALGIVHGALHERNVIVRPDGSLCLTHVSPLLYNDPAVDVDAVIGLLERMGWSSGPGGSPGRTTLRDLSAELLMRSRRGELPAAEPGAGSEEELLEERRIGRRAVWAAVLVALFGAAMAWGIWRWTVGVAESGV